VTFSFYLLGADALLRRTSSLASAMWVSASASVSLGAVAVATGSRLPRWPEEALPVLGMGILTAGAFILLFLGLRRLGAVRTSVLGALEPVTTAILAVVLLHEPLRAGVVGGGILIVVGAVAASMARGDADIVVP
jgi:drug/metabolite transporter (DMT)-like permease